MVRISDIRIIDFPDVSTEQMNAIGKEYELSLEKRSLLSKMLKVESEIMDNKLLRVIVEETK